MADRLLVSTKKGLFVFDRGAGGWRVSRTAFLGDHIGLTLPDPRDGSWYAAMNLGHFGVEVEILSRCRQHVGRSHRTSVSRGRDFR